MNLVDGETAAMAKQTGVGNTGQFEIGGKLHKCSFRPVTATARVLFTGEWECCFKGPMYTGKCCPMGQTAVLEIHNSVVVVMENPVDNCDPEIYRSLSLNLNDFQIVAVKSANGFRAPYEGLFAEAYIIDTPGASSANLKALPFDKITPPVYPFHPVESVSPEVITVDRSAERGAL